MRQQGVDDRWESKLVLRHVEESGNLLMHHMTLMHQIIKLVFGLRTYM